METQSGCENTLTVQQLALFTESVGEWQAVKVIIDVKICLVNIICGWGRDREIVCCWLSLFVQDQDGKPDLEFDIWSGFEAELHLKKCTKKDPGLMSWYFFWLGDRGKVILFVLGWEDFSWIIWPELRWVDRKGSNCKWLSRNKVVQSELLPFRFGMDWGNAS